MKNVFFDFSMYSQGEFNQVQINTKEEVEKDHIRENEYNNFGEEEDSVSKSEREVDGACK